MAGEILQKVIITQSTQKKPWKFGANIMKTKADEQQKQNVRAREIKAKVNYWRGWRVTDKDGSEYFVEKASDIGRLLTDLESVE